MENPSYSEFLKTINISILRYAFTHGWNEARRRSAQIRSDIRDTLYHSKVIPNPFDEVIRLQTEVKALCHRSGETSKARPRRLREGWFEAFAPESQPGLDIGCQFDPLNESFRRWDVLFGDGDAQLMEGVPDQLFHTVYASHVLEHMIDPVAAVRSWYRLLRPGGHLLVSVPHRDLYEKKKTLPSNWNPDHKFFWLPEQPDPPHTLGLRDVIESARLDGAEIHSIRVVDTDYDHSLPPDVHATGEFSIEAIILRRNG